MPQVFMIRNMLKSSKDVHEETDHLLKVGSSDTIVALSKLTKKQ